MKNHIFVLPRAKYKVVIGELSPRQNEESAFIQINEPKHSSHELYGDVSIPMKPDARNVLNLWFDDAEENLPLLNGESLFLFDRSMAEQIYNFVLANTQAKC